MAGSRPGHLEGGGGGGGKDHEAKVTGLWGHTPGICLNFRSLKQHFLVKFPPTRHIEALN